LLHIEFDPHACTGCGLCAESCNENAIVMTSVEELRELDLASFPHVEKFQNTQSDTLEYLLKSPEISPFQALRLKRGYARNMIARGKSNSDLYKAITDVLLMAKLKAEKQTLNYIASVKSSVEDLQEHIHDLLGQAIPDRDFSSVHDTVKRNNGHRISVGELIGTGAHASLNSRELKRKLDLLEKLTQLRDHLEQGYSGGVRVGLALMIFENPYLNGLCNYPENPFDIPAWSQGDIKTAFGVQEALFLNYLEELKLLKRAALEVKGKYHPAVHEQELSELTWNSLSDEEKENIPSVIALGGWEDSGVSEDYISAYSLPMKVVLFEDFSRITPKKGYKAIDFARNTGWSVWQGVQGHENIKYRQLTEFFNQKGPGLYSFLTLEKELWAARETLKERGFIAVASRAWPIIKASTGQGLAFPKIRLEGNPQIKENLVVVRSGDEIDEKKEYTLTWADLVVRMISRKGELEPLEDGGENATPASVVINGQINESGGAVMNPAGKNLWVQPTSGIIEESKQVLGNWQALKQYAGYSETASEEVKEEIKSIFEKELNEEKRKIQKLYDEKATAQKGEIKKLLKEKLVALALKRK
ncbi:MAG: hypothetical protein OEW75_16675, partial [Cyclobacteriaceae bacterium]|nr:hypothetical protein [Cyclobacteriaceae bacterium]